MVLNKESSQPFRVYSHCILSMFQTRIPLFYFTYFLQRVAVAFLFYLLSSVASENLLLNYSSLDYDQGREERTALLI